jgi:hypothetical protein
MNKERKEEFKKMLDLGVISQQEYDKLSIESKTDKPKRRKYLVPVLIFILVSLGSLSYYFFSKPNVESLAIELSKDYVSYQLENNTAYLNKLYDIQEKINSGEYMFASSLDSELNVLNLQYVGNSLDETIEASYTNIEKTIAAAELEWPKTEADGKKFWFTYDVAVNNDTELKQTTEKITKLINEIQAQKENIQLTSAEDIEVLKEKSYGLMRTIFSNWVNESFDPFMYFAPSVERFFSYQHLSPDQVINTVHEKIEFSYATYTPNFGSFELIEKNKDHEIWEYQVEVIYFDYNESSNKVRKKHRLMLNNSDKIMAIYDI